MVLDDSAAAPGSPALYDSRAHRWWTHREVRDAARAWSRDLLPPSPSLLFLLCRNSVRSAVGYLAGLEGRHATALLDAAIDPAFLTLLIDSYRPDAIAVDDQGEEAIWQTVSHDARYRRHTTGPDALTVWWHRDGTEGALHPDLAVLLSTSGTTGSPKFVRLSAANIRANARSIREALRIDAAERAITSLPLFYSFGLSVLNSHLVAGASVVLTGYTIMDRDFWDLFREQACTSLAGVPYTYEMLRRLGFARMSLPSLRTMTQAGGRLAPPVIAEFHELLHRRGAGLAVMYGQTEATARIACLPPDRLPEKLGAVGYAIPGGTITLEMDGVPVTDPGQPGEVIYRGPNVMLGYALSREDLVRGDELGGVLRTGDIGTLDPDGCLRIVGRLKRFSKVYGLRINLDELEALLRAHAPVAVTATDETITVVWEGADSPALRDAVRALAQQLKLHPRTFAVHFCERLPLLPNGKVDYRRLPALSG